MSNVSLLLLAIYLLILTYFQAYNRSKFKTLTKWFCRAVEKTKDIEEKSYFEEDSCESFDCDSSLSGSSSDCDSVKDIEKEIYDSVDEWKKSADLCVTVTGSKGVGKSYLVNTLLEATAPDTYDFEEGQDIEEVFCEESEMDEAEVS